MITNYAQSSYLNDTGDIPSLVRNVQMNGRNVESRYGSCLEILGGKATFPSGSLISRVGINYALGWMEMLQLIAGVYDPDGLRRVAPLADHKLFTYKMAYGPRVKYAIPSIIRALMENPETRQAVVQIAKPGDGASSDLPCTLSMQFLIRDEALHGIVAMRSWDLCRGLPYDIMMFSGLLQAIGRCIQVPSGNITVTAGSAHIYLDQLDKLPQLSRKRWMFVDGPDNWKDFVGWATNNIPLLTKGGTPGCIHICES